MNFPMGQLILILCCTLPATSSRALAQTATGRPANAAIDAAPIIADAVKLLMSGQDVASRGLANNIWLSSAEPEYRRKAWRILMLTEPAQEPTQGKVEFKIRAPGARDHDRFKLWLEEQFVDWNKYVDSVHVHYKSVLLTETRLSEDALITFYLEKGFDSSVLIDRIKSSHRKPYPTDKWFIVIEKKLIR